jgi:hypothetical protein
MTGLEFLGTIGVGKGWMISYHHMCRWNSGFFYKHPSLRDYDWYWRVEPDVSCNEPITHVFRLRAPRFIISATLTTMYFALCGTTT